MENNLIFSAQKAQELNALAKKIDERLLLFVGYEPMKHFTHAETGFYLGCLNLYKCTVDSMILWRQFNKLPYKTYLPSHGTNTLSEIDTMQDVLRSMLAHNNSSTNGYIQQQRIQSYNAWVQKIAGVTSLDNESSYSLALNAVLDLGNRLFQTLEHFLNEAARSNNASKSELVDHWIEDAAYWYSNKKYHEIYFGYLHQHIKGRNDIPTNTEEALLCARRMLIRNAMKKQADVDYFKQVGYHTNLECAQKLTELSKNSNIATVRTRMLQDAAEAENCRQDDYAYYDQLGRYFNHRKNAFVEHLSKNDLESTWQAMLKEQLVARAANVSSLSPEVWLDDHIHEHIGRLDISEINYAPFQWIPLHGR